MTTSPNIDDTPSSDLATTDYKLGAGQALIGTQMLFVALVLVPLLTASLGTLIFQITTRGQVLVFRASSFAFIAPITCGVQA